MEAIFLFSGSNSTMMACQTEAMVLSVDATPDDGQPSGSYLEGPHRLSLVVIGNITSPSVESPQMFTYKPNPRVAQVSPTDTIVRYLNLPTTDTIKHLCTFGRGSHTLPGFSTSFVFTNQYITGCLLILCFLLSGGLNLTITGESLDAAYLPLMVLTTIYRGKQDSTKTVVGHPPRSSTNCQ